MGALFDTVYVSVYKYFNAPFGAILIKGSSTPGKLADFVVLSDDLFTVDRGKIKDIQIVRTVVGGSTVYQA